MVAVIFWGRDTGCCQDHLQSLDGVVQGLRRGAAMGQAFFHVAGNGGYAGKLVGRGGDRGLGRLLLPPSLKGTAQYAVGGS
eukprot:CAMPEP_0117690640 /NCGR_PEP_ID=MMETSP0804-20121206/25241_1 /TAXON_ID=1074897 /ORGANISM="Tetraselmis astigmatica, Strain CCMP880" /LENGTH=80 /DNA_ID=CAMNT_0005503713 /DNA_START=72 /DNA_END=311 /DNA_ORIENTATION=-